jgi:hypothetical protein
MKYRIKQNLWGNWNGYQGTRKVIEFGTDQIAAKYWLLENTRDSQWPETYLHIRDEKSGETWIVPLRGNASLNLKHQIKKWITSEFGGELFLNGELMPKLSGDYYGKIMTDGRPPDSVVCWDGAGFYLSNQPSYFGRTH